MLTWSHWKNGTILWWGSLRQAALICWLINWITSRVKGAALIQTAREMPTLRKVYALFKKANQFHAYLSAANSSCLLSKMQSPNTLKSNSSQQRRLAWVSWLDGGGKVETSGSGYRLVLRNTNTHSAQSSSAPMKSLWRKARGKARGWTQFDRELSSKLQ